MTTIVKLQKTHSVVGRHRVSLILILTLLTLRIPLVTGSVLFLGREPDWVTTVYEVGTYLLVAFLLIWESQSLFDYHITPLAIWIIILFKPLETIYSYISQRIDFPLAFPRLPSLIILISALGLLVYFRAQLFQKGAIQWRDLKWLLFGGLVGLGYILITCYPLSLQIEHANPIHKNFWSSYLIGGLVGIPQQIGYAAVSEEPVFRGFLWGYLRRSGWRDLWIWLFQAGLFVLAHLYYINTAPISFWFIVPLGALVLGWLAWRSRSIATSMVAHGISNSLGSTLSYLIALFRL